jgi:predicted N-acetyltransferase YhbS
VTPAAAVEADLVAHVARLFEFGAEVHREPDATWFLSGDDSPHHNGVLRALLQPGRLEAGVDRLLEPFAVRGVPLMWWVFTPPEAHPESVETILRTRGFELDADLPGMALELTTFEAPPTPSGCDVRRVDADGFGEWARVVALAFDDPSFEEGASARAFRSHGFGDEAPFRHFVCRRDGEPVAASTLSLGGGVAGLANIAVVPRWRRRGLGAAVAAAALLEARGLGLRLGVLSAGELGRPLYERLGFREVSRHRSYVRRRSD